MEETKSSKSPIGIQIIKNRLYWISDKQPPKNQPNAFFFCIDQDLVYEPFTSDFGPLNMSSTYRFVTELESLLQDSKYKNVIIYHYTSTDSAKRANAAYLMGAYQVIILGKSAQKAWEPLSNVTPSFVDFRDASMGPCTYKCTILDCLRGLEYAIKLKWFDVRNFDLTSYQFYERVENGDINCIVPQKFYAFSGPSSTTRDADGMRTFTPEDYISIFKNFGVTTVIRLNKASYDADRFQQNGIKHHDLYFLDGSVPPNDIVAKFLEICENEKGKIAVHCKAGLGRTGSLIGAYVMKHYHFPAPDFIGYIRVMRPGSVLGPQQFWCCEKQSELIKSGQNSPIWKNVASLVKPIEDLQERLSKMNLGNQGEMSPEDLKQKTHGEKDQGNYLKKQ